MTAALQALSKFKRLAESHGVDTILAAATSATREAGTAASSWRGSSARPASVRA